jgi:hypothetical protein
MLSDIINRINEDEAADSKEIEEVWQKEIDARYQ